MKQLKDFESAIDKASLDTSRLMSAHLRNEANASGWGKVTRSVGVSYTKNGFDIHAHDSHLDQIHDLEYGTPSQQPTAAIRRFKNRTQDSENFLINRLHQHLGGEL